MSEKVADNGQNGLNPMFVVNLDCVPPASKQPDVDASSVDSMFSSDEQQPPKRSCKKRQIKVVHHVLKTTFCPGCVSTRTPAARNRGRFALRMHNFGNLALLTNLTILCALFLLMLTVVWWKLMKENFDDYSMFLPRGNNTCH